LRPFIFDRHFCDYGFLDGVLAVRNALRQTLLKPPAGTFWAFLCVNKQIAVHKSQRGAFADNGAPGMRTFQATYNYKTAFRIHKTPLFLIKTRFFS
jgi:hypothetical protein